MSLSKVRSGQQERRPYLGATSIDPFPVPSSGDTAQPGRSGTSGAGPFRMKDRPPSLPAQGRRPTIQQPVDLSLYGFGVPPATCLPAQYPQRPFSQPQHPRNISLMPLAVPMDRHSSVLPQNSDYWSHRLTNRVLVPQYQLQCIPKARKEHPSRAQAHCPVFVENRSNDHLNSRQQLGHAVIPEQVGLVTNLPISIPSSSTNLVPNSPSEIPRRTLPFKVSKAKGKEAVEEPKVSSEESHKLQTYQAEEGGSADKWKDSRVTASSSPRQKLNAERCEKKRQFADHYINCEHLDTKKMAQCTAPWTVNEPVQQLESSLTRNRSVPQQHKLDTVGLCSAEKFADELDKTKKTLEKATQNDPPLELTTSRVQQAAESFYKAIPDGDSLLSKVILQQFVECFSGDRYEEMLQYIQDKSI